MSELRLQHSACDLCADERAGVVYVAVSGSSAEGEAVAYSLFDGSLLANYTTTNPPIGYISDIANLPPSPQTGPMLVVVDDGNRRFIHIDPSGKTAPISQPVLNNTECYEVAFSLQQQRAVFYVSCTAYPIINGSFVISTFVHKWHVTDPTKPVLTNTFVSPAGLLSYLDSIVVGLEQHL